MRGDLLTRARGAEQLAAYYERRAAELRRQARTDRESWLAQRPERDRTGEAASEGKRWEGDDAAE
ncbi:hypothetical protein L6R50_08970 [Myxococcota bacterium]|nr:hypothetical protein [Myxococcota bacterium]